MDLSAVIVAKNEENQSKYCIESVLKAFEKYDSKQVILVDSISNDKTIEIAMDYPIEIYQLKDVFDVTPSAGRYIGYLKAKNNFILFIDGNRVLESKNFDKLFSIIKNNDDIGGISGKISSEYCNDSDDNLITKFIFQRIKHFYDSIEVGNVKVLAGPVSIFRKEALDFSGPHNPFLRADEEAELCYRVVSKGYSLLRTPYIIAYQEICFRSFFHFLYKYEWIYNKWVGMFKIYLNPKIFLLPSRFERIYNIELACYIRHFQSCFIFINERFFNFNTFIYIMGVL